MVVAFCWVLLMAETATSLTGSVTLLPIEALTVASLMACDTVAFAPTKVPPDPAMESASAVLPEVGVMTLALTISTPLPLMVAESATEAVMVGLASASATDAPTLKPPTATPHADALTSGVATAVAFTDSLAAIVPRRVALTVPWSRAVAPAPVPATRPPAAAMPELVTAPLSEAVKPTVLYWATLAPVRVSAVT